MDVEDLQSGVIVLYHVLCDAKASDYRAMTVVGHPRLPDDEYGLVDAYCAGPDCDCRVAYLFVMRASQPTAEAAASISFGWEPQAFYDRWMGEGANSASAKTLKGPSLMLWGHQGRYAEELLQLFRPQFQDPVYVARLRRRYRTFKRALRQMVDAVDR